MKVKRIYQKEINTKEKSRKNKKDKKSENQQSTLIKTKNRIPRFDSSLK